MIYRNHPLFYRDFIKRPKGGEPLDSSLIYGIDTESFHSTQLSKLHTNMVTVSDINDDIIHEPKIGESPFQYMMDGIFNTHALEMRGKLRRSHTELNREVGKRGTGRAKMPVVLLAFYNLEYDFQRLFKEDSTIFNMARINVEGIKCEIDGYEVENVHMVLSGSAPHFTWIIRKDNYVLKVYAMDLWGYLKQGLGASAKALGIIDKLPVDKEYFHIPLEELTDTQLDELRTYAKRDGKVTRELYLSLLYFLTEFSEDVVTSKGILPPSAPAAAARIAFAKMDDDVLKQPPKFAVQLSLEGYNGGLVFSRATGEFENILVGDRNSAYPTMMSMLPNPEKVKYILRIRPTPDELVGKIGFCRASFEIESDHVPFITSDDDSGRSNHAQGRYDYQTISIYELMAGYLIGTINHITIHEAVYLKYEEDAENNGIFYDFVKYFHNLKNENEKGSALYMLAKLLMNALYGKLIEMRNPESVIIPLHIRKLRVPTGIKTMIEHDKKYRYRFYNSILNCGEGLEEILNEYTPTDFDGFVSIEEVITDVTLTAGTYFYPFYASLITAGQRAWMSVYTYYTKAILADTDSAFTNMSEPQFIKAIKVADKITTKIGVGRCRVGTELGDIDIEMRNGHGYISGIKQYGLTGDTSKGSGKHKIAHHTILSPDGISDEEEKDKFFIETIKQLSLGNPVTYKVKPRPVRIKTALLRGMDFGKFESSIRTITPKADPRLLVVAKAGKITYYRWKRRNEL